MRCIIEFVLMLPVYHAGLDLSGNWQQARISNYGCYNVFLLTTYLFEKRKNTNATTYIFLIDSTQHVNSALFLSKMITTMIRVHIPTL